MVEKGYTIDVAKKVLQKAIVNELYKNGVIDFASCSSVIKKIDNEINKIKSKENNDNVENNKITIKIPL